MKKRAVRPDIRPGDIQELKDVQLYFSRLTQPLLKLLWEFTPLERRGCLAFYHPFWFSLGPAITLHKWTVLEAKCGYPSMLDWAIREKGETVLTKEHMVELTRSGSLAAWNWIANTPIALAKIYEYKLNEIRGDMPTELIPMYRQYSDNLSIKDARFKWYRATEFCRQAINADRPANLCRLCTIGQISDNAGCPTDVYSTALKYGKAKTLLHLLLINPEGLTAESLKPHLRDFLKLCDDTSPSIPQLFTHFLRLISQKELIDEVITARLSLLHLALSGNKLSHDQFHLLIGVIHGFRIQQCIDLTDSWIPCAECTPLIVTMYGDANLIRWHNLPVNESVIQLLLEPLLAPVLPSNLDMYVEILKYHTPSRELALKIAKVHPKLQQKIRWSDSDDPLAALADRIAALI